MPGGNVRGGVQVARARADSDSEMARPANLTLSRRVHLAVGTVVVVALGSLVAVVHDAWTTTRTFDSLLNRNRAHVAILGLEASTIGYGVAVLAHLDDPDPRHLARMEKAIADFARLHREYQQAVEADADRHRGEELAATHHRLTELGARLLSGADATGRQQADVLELRRRMDEVLDEPWQPVVAPQATRSEPAALGPLARLSGIAAVLALIVVAVSALAVWELRRKVVTPLRALANGVAAFSTGRLDDEIPTRAGDEIGDVAAAFNQMVATTRDQQAMLERRVAERTAELARQAERDSLTGLANRAGMNRALATMLARARRRRETAAVLLLDLDGFKAVNDTLGHEAGDRLLEQVALRLSAQVRHEDAVARLGGDEFCVLLEAVTCPRDAADVAERCLAAVAEPVQLSGRAMIPRTSIGIALFPDAGGDPVQLLQAADTAMYAAKHAGKHRYQFYEPAMTAAVEEQVAMETDLRAALEFGGFELHYQPQVSLSSGSMTGVEALIRWYRPGHGLIFPDAFIPTAQRLGLIDKLGEWVLQTACAQAQAWRCAGLRLDVAVNISPTHFVAARFADQVQRTLSATGLDPSLLELEITESVVQHGPKLCEATTRIRALGVRVAIDDFGAGFSSVVALRRTPVDTVKLDRHLVNGLLDDDQATVVLGAILGMASGLNLAAVAEGVESSDQVHVLRGLGCPSAQGHFFSPAVPPASIPLLAQSGFHVEAVPA